MLSLNHQYPTTGIDAWSNEPEAPDAVLVTRSQGGDVQAFNLLVERYQQRVYAVCSRMLGHGDADDVTQEVFLAAFRSIQRYRGGSFISWLLRIATNKCLDVLRVRSRRPFISLDTAVEGTGDAPRQFHDSSESPEQHLLRMDLARDLEHALLQLPPEQRLLVVLSDIQGYSYEEIVASTGWPTGTVKSRLSRGRARLRDTLRSRELTIGP